MGLLGLTVWFVAACLLSVEAANLKYDQNLHAWEVHGRQGKKPR